MNMSRWFTAALLAVGCATAQAHCDSMDGPVVRDAQAALTARDVTATLKWVRKQDEPAVREAFQRTLAVRGESDAARELADQYFFETLVRLHRAGEGEPYTGLKPAGSAEPAIKEADEALDRGTGKDLAVKLGNEVQAAVRERYNEALERRAVAAKGSVTAGRAYVQAYVEYIHFVERVRHLVQEGAGEGEPDAPAHEK